MRESKITRTLLAVALVLHLALTVGAGTLGGCNQFADPKQLWYDHTIPEFTAGTTPVFDVYYQGVMG